MTQKLGHVMSFFFLGAITYWKWPSRLVVILVGLGAGFTTEILQLYFSRSGRLLDVGYDVCGSLIFLGALIGYPLIRSEVMVEGDKGTMKRRRNVS